MSLWKEVFTTPLTNTSLWMRIAIDVLVVASVIWFDVSAAHITALFWLDLVGACACFGMFMSADDLWFNKVMSVLLGMIIPLVFAPLLFAVLKTDMSPTDAENPLLVFYPYYDLSIYFISIWKVQSANYQDFIAHRGHAHVPFSGYITALLFACLGFPFAVAFLMGFDLSLVVAVVVALGLFRTGAELLRRRQLIKAYRAALADEA